MQNNSSKSLLSMPSDSDGSGTGDWLSMSYIFMNVASGIIALGIILLNVLTLFIILIKPRVWDVTYTFIINLAVADTFNGVLLMYNVFYNTVYFQIFYECIFRFGCVNGILFCSVYVLLGLGFDRYIKIISPLHYMRFIREYTVKIYISVVWFLTGIIAVGPYISWINTPHATNKCAYFSVIKDEYTIIVCIIMFAALCMQCFMYGHILLIASSKVLPESLSLSIQRRRFRPSKTLALWWKPTKAVLVIVGVNLCSMTPVGIYLLLVASGHIDYLDVIQRGTILVYISSPVYLMSLLNPFLYAFKIKDIRSSICTKIKWPRTGIAPAVQKTKITWTTTNI